MMKYNNTVNIPFTREHVKKTRMGLLSLVKAQLYSLRVSLKTVLTNRRPLPIQPATTVQKTLFTDQCFAVISIYPSVGLN